MPGGTVLGRRLQRSRERKGLTQEALAKLADISLFTVSRIERGRAPQITSGVLERLSDVLEVSTDYLLGLTTDSRSRRLEQEEDENLIVVPHG